MSKIKKGIFSTICALLLAAFAVTYVFAWNTGVKAVPDCEKVTISARPKAYVTDNWGPNETRWVPVIKTIEGLGVFNWNGATSRSGKVIIPWQEQWSNDFGIAWVDAFGHTTKTVTPWSSERDPKCK